MEKWMEHRRNSLPCIVLSNLLSHWSTHFQVFAKSGWTDLGAESLLDEYLSDLHDDDDIADLDDSVLIEMRTALSSFQTS